MQYINNSLTTVIFRVDFLNPITVDDKSLNDACSSIYPVIQEETVNEHNVQTSLNEKGEVTIERNTNTFVNKKYSNRQLSRLITVSPRFVFTEVKDYSSYEETSNTFATVFEAIIKANPNVTIARVGMRYINQIDLTNYKKSTRKNYVKNTLFESPFDGVIENAALARTQHLVEFVIEDYRVRCVTGLFNPDYPAAIKRNVVTLDFDAFIQGGLTSEEVQKYLDKFHSSIKSLYEASILQKQRELMKII